MQLWRQDMRNAQVYKMNRLALRNIYSTAASNRTDKMSRLNCQIDLFSRLDAI
jgi:hypothetical protein